MEKKLHITGPFWGESTGHRWIPLTEASDAELWCFLWSSPEQIVENTIKMLVIWDAIDAHYDATVMKCMPLTNHLMDQDHSVIENDILLMDVDSNFTAIHCHVSN